MIQKKSNLVLTDLLPQYKIFEADDLGELEELVQDFLQKHEAEGNNWFIAGPPQLINLKEEDEEFFIQAVGAYANND